MTDKAGDVWSNFEGTDAGLYQVQIEHAARPSIMFGLRESFTDFLKTVNTKSEGEIPATLDDLQGSGIRLVISDKQDPDNAGFVQWRCAFYCAGDEGFPAVAFPACAKDVLPCGAKVPIFNLRGDL